MSDLRALGTAVKRLRNLSSPHAVKDKTGLPQQIK
jgi:hypothetical protein